MEYILSFGALGEFGRFRSLDETQIHRGDRVVARTPRGLELAEVLCPATSRHESLLEGEPLGELLRLADADDFQRSRLASERSEQIFEKALTLTASLDWILVDVEVLLDLKQAILHFVQGSECDLLPITRELGHLFDCQVTLQDLTAPSETSSGCGSCGSGAGCGSGCGSCGSGELQEHFAQLREQMNLHNRTPLL